MSDDPFADGGFDDEQDGGDVFGDSTNNVGEDVFGVTEEQNTGDPFGDDLGDSEPAQEYTSVNNDEGDLMGGPFADNSGEQKAEIPAPAPAVPEEEDCSALNAWRTEWRSQLEAKCPVSRWKLLSFRPLLSIRYSILFWACMPCSHCFLMVLFHPGGTVIASINST